MHAIRPWPGAIRQRCPRQGHVRQTLQLAGIATQLIAYSSSEGCQVLRNRNPGYLRFRNLPEEHVSLLPVLERLRPVLRLLFLLFKLYETGLHTTLDRERPWTVAICARRPDQSLVRQTLQFASIVTQYIADATSQVDRSVISILDIYGFENILKTLTLTN